MHLLLKRVKPALPHDAVDDVVNLTHEHGESVLVGGRLLEEIAEDDHLAEDGRRLRQGERRVELEDALLVRQHKVGAVPGLVREGGDVALRAGEIEQLEGSVAVGGAAVRAASLAVLRGHVDALLVHHLLEQTGHRRGELFVPRLDDVHGFFPGVRFGRGPDVDRRVAIGPRHLLQPRGVLQDALLEGVVSLAVVHAGGLHGVEERVDHLVRHVVPEVALRPELLEPALGVLRVPRPGDHVQRQRGDALELLQPGVERLHALVTSRGVLGRRHLGEEHLHVDLLVAILEPKPRQLVAVELDHLALARERRADGQRSFNLFAEVVGLGPANVVDVRPVLGELGGILHLRVERLLRHIRELQGEERELVAGDGGVALKERRLALLRLVVVEFCVA